MKRQRNMIKLNLEADYNTGIFEATPTELFDSMEKYGIYNTISPTRKDLQQVLDSDMPVNHKLYFVYALGIYDGRKLCGQN